MVQWFFDLVAQRSWYLVPQVTQRLGDAGAQWLGDVLVAQWSGDVAGQWLGDFVLQRLGFWWLISWRWSASVVGGCGGSVVG